MKQTGAADAVLSVEQLEQAILKAVADSAWEQEIECQQELLDLVEDPTRQGDVLHRIGDLYFHKLGDLDQAVQYYAEALFLKPECEDLLKVTGELYIAREQWNDAVEILVRRAMHADDAVKQLFLWHRAAEISHIRLDDRDSAFSYYNRALSTMLENMSPLLRLEEILGDAEHREQLQLVYDEALDFLDLWVDRIRASRDELTEAEEHQASEAAEPAELQTSEGSAAESEASAPLPAPAQLVETPEEPTPPARTLEKVDVLQAAAAVVERVDVSAPSAAPVEAIEKVEASDLSAVAVEKATAPAAVVEAPEQPDPPSVVADKAELPAPPAPTVAAVERVEAPQAPPAVVESVDVPVPPAPAVETPAPPVSPETVEAPEPVAQAIAALETAESPEPDPPGSPSAEVEGVAGEAESVASSQVDLAKEPAVEPVVAQTEQAPNASPVEIAESAATAVVSAASEAAPAQVAPAVAEPSETDKSLPPPPPAPPAPSAVPGAPPPPPVALDQMTLEQKIQLQSRLWTEFEEARTRKDWKGAAARLEGSLVLDVDPQINWKCHAHLGELYLSKLKSLPKSLDHFQQALKIRPRSKMTLVHLLEIYTKTRDFQGAVDVIKPLCDLESDTKKLSLYNATLGTIYADQLEQVDEAVECLNRALDYDPKMLKQFEKLEKLLIKEKKWQALVKNYRLMMQRISDIEELRDYHTNLLRSLGKVCLNELDKLEDALVAFQKLRQNAPDDVGIQETICEIYEGMVEYNPGIGERLVVENRRLLQMRPGNVASYKALAEEFIRTSQYDQAWLVSSVLVAKGFADSREEGFYLKHRRGVPQFSTPILGSQYASYLFPERLKGPITQILELVGSQLPNDVFPSPPKKKSKKKNRVDVGQNMVLDQSLRTVLANFDVDIPDVYRNLGGDGISALPTRPACMLISPDWLDDRPLTELAFALGTQLIYFMPHFSLVPMGLGLVTDVVHAAISVCSPSYPVPESEEIASFKKMISKKHDNKMLWSYCQTLLASDKPLEIDSWFNDVERLAHRVGLLLCNDFDAALKITTSLHFERRVHPDDLVEELSLFAVSESYSRLRRELGIGI